MNFKFGQMFWTYHLSYNSVNTIVALKEIKINRAIVEKSMIQKKMQHCNKPKIS